MTERRKPSFETLDTAPHRQFIELKGVRQNNLNGIDLNIPFNRMTVVTGVSGSGKSSLAFDTLFAEGQRRYIETFSPYARQFFDRMDKPKADRIEGIPPAIAIEQKNTVKSSRSTVGTMTEICDYVKDLWLHFSRPYCPECRTWVKAETPMDVWDYLRNEGDCDGLVHVTFPSRFSDDLGKEECLRLIGAQGFRRGILDGKIWEWDELTSRPELLARHDVIDVVQDRLRTDARSRSRVIEACESAFDFGQSELALYRAQPGGDRLTLARKFSRRPLCSGCGIKVPEASRSFFSFNSPLGACPTCSGFGRKLVIDYPGAIEFPDLTLEQGAVGPWRQGHGLISQRDMMAAAQRDGVPVDVPFAELSPAQRDWVIYGHPEYDKAENRHWPQYWYGVKGYYDWVETKAYRPSFMAILNRTRIKRTCPDCSGSRLRREVEFYRVAHHGEGDDRSAMTLPQFYALPLHRSLAVVDGWRRDLRLRKADSLSFALEAVGNRLRYLIEAGLAYLSLDRASRTLSGGETERINLASCLGTGLVNTLFVLDEPSVGLHAADIRKLIRILHRLRDRGNTLVVVEHDSAIIRAADHVVDIGPESGAKGGSLVFSGSVAELKKCRRSVTSEFLNGRDTLDIGDGNRAVDDKTPRLCVRGAHCHNLRDFSVEIPLERLVCVTGVSGSGKTTLVKEVLARRLESLAEDQENAAFGANGEEVFCRPGGEPPRPILVDQSPIGKSSRSNPALYTGVFVHIRHLFAASVEAKDASLSFGNFSFNSNWGRCERCGGAGFEKVEMQFLSDVYVRCSECDGSRYNRRIRETVVNLEQFAEDSVRLPGRTAWSIVDLLAATVDEAVSLLQSLVHRRAHRTLAGLRRLQQVGLGYLQLGQPIHTLSGGECQRLKVIRFLGQASSPGAGSDRLIFLFDEPTTGLHFADVKALLGMFRALVSQGYSVLVIEHHLEFIEQADWVIDLGPGAGADGGRVVAEGPPAAIARNPASVTGQMLCGNRA